MTLRISSKQIYSIHVSMFKSYGRGNINSDGKNREAPKARKHVWGLQQLQAEACQP